MAKPILSQDLITMYRSGKFVSCSNFHDFSCEWKAFQRFSQMAKFFTLFYGPAHVLPVLIFKLKELKKNPKHVITHVGTNVARSVLFGCFSLGVIQYMLCQLPKIFKGANHITYLILGFVSSFPIFIEAASRRGELALYLLPRTLESVWNIMKKFGFPLRIKKFEVFLFSLAMAFLSYFLYNEDKHIKPTYKSTLRHIFGNN